MLIAVVKCSLAIPAAFLVSWAILSIAPATPLVAVLSVISSVPVGIVTSIAVDAVWPS